MNAFKVLLNLSASNFTDPFISHLPVIKDMVRDVIYQNLEISQVVIFDLVLFIALFSIFKNVSFLRKPVIIKTAVYLIKMYEFYVMTKIQVWRVHWLEVYAFLFFTCLIQGMALVWMFSHHLTGTT